MGGNHPGTLHVKSNQIHNHWLWTDSEVGLELDVH